VNFSAAKHLVFVKFFFSKKFGNFSIFYFPLWYISTMNACYAPIVSKMSAHLLGLNITFSKMKLHALFNNVLMKKKIMGTFYTTSFFKRYLFFSSDAIVPFLGEVNLEMSLPFFFNYMPHNSFSNIKYSVFFKRGGRRLLTAAVFLKAAALLTGFGLGFLYQRFALFFRNSFFFKSYF